MRRRRRISDRQFDEAQREMRRGRIDEALELAERGAERAERAENSPAAWRFRLLAADARLTRLEFPAAMAVLDLELPSGPGFDSLRGRQLHLLARAKVAQGQLAAAQPLVAEALPLAALDPALLLDLELLQSQLLYRSGKAADADVLLAGARDRVQKEGDPYRIAQVSNTTGMGLVTRGRYDEALPYFDAVVGEPAVEGTTIQGSALNNAGLCRARLGQFDRAVELQQRAVRVQERGRRQNYVQALGELGATYLLQDDLARGSEYLQQAFSIAAESGLASDAALFARNLAAASVALGKWDDAERYNQEAARLAGVAAAPASPYTTVTEAQVAAGRGQRDVATRLFRQAVDVPDAPPGVRWMAYDGLARARCCRGRGRRGGPAFRAGAADGRADAFRAPPRRLPDLVHLAAGAVLPGLRRSPAGTRPGRSRPGRGGFEPGPCPRRAPGRGHAGYTGDGGIAEAARPIFGQHAAVLLDWPRAVMGVDRHRRPHQRRAAPALPRRSRLSSPSTRPRFRTR